jgi:hypothetical protein
MAKAEMTLERQEVFNAIFEYVRKHYGVEGRISADIQKDYRGNITGAKIEYEVNKVRQPK